MKTQIFAGIICVLLIGLMLRQPAPPTTLTTPQIASKLDAIQAELSDLIDRAADQNSELVAALASLSGNQLELADAMAAVLLAQQPASAEKITQLKTIDRPKNPKSLSNVLLVSAIDETAKVSAKVKDSLDGSDPDLEARVTALEAELMTLKAACQNCNCISGSLQYKPKASGGSNGSVSYSPYTTTTTTYSTKSGGSNGSVSYSPYVTAMASVPQNVRIVQPRTVTRATVNQPVPVNMPMEEQFIQYDPNAANSQCVQLADGSYDCGGNNVQTVPTVQTKSRPRVFPNLFRGR